MQPFIKKSLIVFWSIILAPIVIVSLIFSLIATGNLGFMPSFEDLENPIRNIASEVITEDNVSIGKYYYQNRSMVDFNDVSQHMVNAIVAIEDIRFEKHSGIDGRGLGRVFFKTLLMGNSDAGGGSTLTQQLAKNLFGRDTTYYKSSILRKLNLGVTKFKEWVTAIRLERNYTKKEILVMYLNTVFYGSNSYGIKAASETFFNTTPDSLKIEEAALLAGIVNAPTRYNPVINPERARLRRNVVLFQMNKYGFITDTQFDSISLTPIKLNYKIKDHNEGIAPHFREYIRTAMLMSKPQRKSYANYQSYQLDSAKWESDPLLGWIYKHKKPDGSYYDIYKDGLRIHTTLNSSMQIYAEEAVLKHVGYDLQPAFNKEKKGRKTAPFSDLDQEQVDHLLNQAMKGSDRYWAMKREGKDEVEIQKAFKNPVKMKVFTWKGTIDTIMSPWDSIRYYKFILRAGFMAIDPHNGYIKAYVGSPNFEHFKFDHVSTGKRQVGSTIKPFLYTIAMQEGYSPCYKVPNVPQTFVMGDTVWTPKNSDISGKEGELVSLQWGLANSINYISAWLVKQFNPQAVIDIMRKLGISGELLPVPSIILGTPEISLYEMTAAYGAFANKGVYTKPIFVTKIEDKAGNIITSFQSHKEEAISEKTAALMTILLRNVVYKGTGVRLRYKYQVLAETGGKTGTTQNQSDGWFISITPNLVTGSWVGGEYRSIHFDGILLGQAANTALPIYARFITKVYADSSMNVKSTDLFEPVDGVGIDCAEYEQEITEENYHLIEENY